MDSCTYSLRLVSCENKEALYKAWFNGKISDADLAIMKHPDNKIEMTFKKSAKALRIEPYFSMLPQFNTPVDYPESLEIKLGDPWNCTSKITLNGKAMKEVASFDDGNVYTFDMVFSSQGASQKVSSNKDGHITTCFWEAVELGVDGFYMLESHVDLDKAMMEMGIKASDANDMLDGMAMQIMEENGTFTFTDYFGNGMTKTESFRLNEEYVSLTPEFGLEMDCLAVKTGPNTFKATQKDKKSGKTQIWTLEFTPDSVIFNVEKPLETVKASCVYRRYPALLGSWKTITSDNVEAGMRTLNMPESQIEAIVNDKATMTLSYLGKGRFQQKSDSKVMPMEPMVWKSGEEFSMSVCGFSFTEVITLTRTGMVGAQKFPGGGATTITIKAGKTFTVMESQLMGKPETKAVYIMARC